MQRLYRTHELEFQKMPQQQKVLIKKQFDYANANITAMQKLAMTGTPLNSQEGVKWFDRLLSLFLRGFLTYAAALALLWVVVEWYNPFG